MKVIEHLPAQLSAEELEAEIKNHYRSRRRISKRLRKSYGNFSKTLVGKSDGKSISEMVKKNYYHN